MLAAWALTALAGCVDALVVARGGALLPVYVTGDTTKLATTLAGERWLDAWPLAALVTSFLAASTLAAWLGGRARRHALPPLLLAGLLLFLGLFLANGAWPLPTILATAAAMGAVNQALRKDPGVTFVTGALVRLARDLAAGQAVEAGKNLLRWLALLGGAAAGAACNAALGPAALAVPAGAATLAAVAVLLWPRPAPTFAKEPA
ncbi:DUF1275 family protein [Roseomonas elaeocarpi]|uniref:DUF1275 family protein n=1 Tax=Roseomonas elaeocarpi TaxID=907779 RepID=A0ABV6JME1_9PROT